MSVEAACTAGWGEFADAFVGIDVFGASAPGGTCLDKFGFNVDNVVSCAKRPSKDIFTVILIQIHSLLCIICMY